MPECPWVIETLVNGAAVLVSDHLFAGLRSPRSLDLLVKRSWQRQVQMQQLVQQFWDSTLRSEMRGAPGSPLRTVRCGVRTATRGHDHQ